VSWAEAGSHALNVTYTSQNHRPVTAFEKLSVHLQSQWIQQTCWCCKANIQCEWGHEINLKTCL